MKNIPENLKNHLKKETTTLAWCWIITRKDKTKIGFTDHDQDITINKTICQAKSGLNTSEIESSLGLNVDTTEVTAALAHPTLSEKDLEYGRFDQADVEIWRVNYTDTSQKILMRKGNLGEVTRNENTFSAEIKGMIAQMQKVNGRVFQYGCDAHLGDQRCGINLKLPQYTTNGSVTNIIEDNRIKIRLTTQNTITYTSQWFNAGTLKWRSGDNKDQIFDVKSHQNQGQNHIIEIWQTPTNPIKTGDQFTISTGCDKNISTCRDKFKNTTNFRGFPHMPGNDFVLSYPNTDDPYKNGESIIAG